MMANQPTLGQLLANARSRFIEFGINTPQLDARILLEHVTGFDHAQLIAKENEATDLDCANHFEKVVLRRLEGEPVHRITGVREFYGRLFHLSDETLVPRPDTEILVETALQELGHSQNTLRILDLGTGSGVIGLSLGAEIPTASLVATDISTDALTIAARNAERLRLMDRVHFVRSNMFENIEGKFDLIVSNPPYIPTDVLKGLDREVRDHDPVTALDGGVDGLKFYRGLFSNAGTFMTERALLVIEFGIGQKDELCELAEAKGWSVKMVCQDLAGIDRVMVLTIS